MIPFAYMAPVVYAAIGILCKWTHAYQQLFQQETINDETDETTCRTGIVPDPFGEHTGPGNGGTGAAGRNFCGHG